MQTHEHQLWTGLPVSIGLPMQNVACYILDSNKHQVPVGVVGEIYLGGICVSPGYINLPDQTAERFLEDPFVSGGRMFKSGDYGRLLPNGCFEVHGRMDNQVKLKGYCIELEEISEAMMRHPDVTSAAAIVKDKTHIVSYFTPSTVNVDELRRLVSTYLPVYMVPAVWVPLESMPQSTSGKTDRLALEAMEVVVKVESLETESQKRMAQVWAQILNVDTSEIGATTSFFALGGDSISAIRLVARAKRSGFLLTSNLVMANSTLESMVMVAKEVSAASNLSNAVAICGDVPLTPIQHSSFGHPWKNINYWNLSMTLKARYPIHHAKLQEIITKIVSHHDTLRTRFKYSVDEGWSQTILHESQSGLPNVRFVDIGSVDELESEILKVEQSLDLINGPVYAVTLLTTPENVQYLQFTAHHTVTDLVSWRVLVDHLEPSCEAMNWVQNQLQWDGTVWDDYLHDDDMPQPPSSVTFQAGWVLDKLTTSKLDIANQAYGTNVQELALAALTGSLAELRGSKWEESVFAIMLDGHGREPWSHEIDISSTVGWFTNEYPVKFSGCPRIDDLLMQVKSKMRNVPHKGLSYAAIKFLSPLTKTSQKIKNHRQHNIRFLYSGRFQEIEHADGFFDLVDDINVPQFGAGEVPLSPGYISVAQFNDELILNARVEDWQFSQPDLDKWIELSERWMHRIINHCMEQTSVGTS
ncbi:hypothetical protein AeMF1_003968 [Aphanomyces euteiches]|nr:hypothetical protein AeMF1_003968 [Aphanomyces euteiches]